MGIVGEQARRALRYVAFTSERVPAVRGGPARVTDSPSDPPSAYQGPADAGDVERVCAQLLLFSPTLKRDIRLRTLRPMSDAHPLDAHEFGRWSVETGEDELPQLLYWKWDPGARPYRAPPVLDCAARASELTRLHASPGRRVEFG